MSKAICWLDGKIQSVQEAKFSVMDHGLLYGDGVFEGVRFYNNAPFLPEQHLFRLFDSARAIALQHTWSIAALTKIIHNVIEAFELADGYLRIIITRGDGMLGIDPRHCKQPRLIIIADSLAMVDEKQRTQGAELIIASTRRLPADGLDPRIKSLNYLNHIMARIEANHAGADEAILLNSQGYVTEGSADNLFIVKNDTLLTPAVTDGALAGITRGLVLQLAKEQDMQASEQSLSAYDLHTADECFLTGTGAELIPVRSIDGRVMSHCPGPFYTELSEAFKAYIDHACAA